MKKNRLKNPKLFALDFFHAWIVSWLEEYLRWIATYRTFINCWYYLQFFWESTLPLWTPPAKYPSILPEAFLPETPHLIRSRVFLKLRSLKTNSEFAPENGWLEDDSFPLNMVPSMGTSDNFLCV